MTFYITAPGTGRGYVVKLRAPGLIRTLGPYSTQAEAQAVLRDAVMQAERGRL